jgi:hypothetical protein
MAFRTVIAINGQRFRESWWAPETRTAVRTITTEGRNRFVVELLDYQQNDDPAGGFSNAPVLANNMQQPRNGNDSAPSVITTDYSTTRPDATAPVKKDGTPRNSVMSPTLQSFPAPRVASSTEKRSLTKTYAFLIQFDGSKVKSGITLEAEFIDDGSGSGEGLVIYPGNSNVLKGKWTRLPVGTIEAPKLIDKRTLNALRLVADVPLATARFTDGDTILECLHGETAAGQRKGECQDNYGNKYHLSFHP